MSWKFKGVSSAASWRETVPTVLTFRFNLSGSRINFTASNQYIPESYQLAEKSIDIGSSLSVLSIDFTNFFSLILAANPFAIMILSVLLGGLCGNYLNLKIFSSRVLAIITSLLVIFVASRMGFRIFF